MLRLSLNLRFDKMAIEIKATKLLLVEGGDEVSVFEHMLPILGVTDVQVVNCGGNVQFKNVFPALSKSPSFSDVESYAVIQDADADAHAAFQRIQSVLDRCQQPVPKSVNSFVSSKGVKVGVYILPGNGESGMLEDLYLKTLGGHPLLDCIDRCVDELKAVCPPCSDKGGFGLSSNLSKARALGTFMATKGPHNRLGHAAKDGYWDLSHGAMSDLASFLKNI